MVLRGSCAVTATSLHRLPYHPVRPFQSCSLGPSFPLGPLSSYRSLATTKARGRVAGVAGRRGRQAWQASNKFEEERGFANPSRLSWVISHLWSALYLFLDALGLHCRGVKSVRAPRLASPTRAKTGYILHSMRSGSDKPPSHPKGGRLERFLYDSNFFFTLYFMADHWPREQVYLVAGYPVLLAPEAIRKLRHRPWR